VCPQGYFCEEGTLTLDPAAPTKHRPYPCPAGTFCLGGVASPTNIEWIPKQPYGQAYAQLCTEGTYCKTGAYLSAGTGLCFLGKLQCEDIILSNYHYLSPCIICFL
jgi:hypothetical protein